jgi:tetratricopeptide (TPR) repeat protein
MKVFFLVIAIGIIAPCCSAQKKEIIDSLKMLLNNTQNDSAKSYLLNKISLQYGWRNRRVEQLKYLEESIKLADKIHNIQCQAFGKYSLGIYYNAIAKYKEAIFNTGIALELYKKCGYRLGIASAFQMLGQYQYHDHKEDAIKNYLSASYWFQQIDQLSDAAVCENQLGLLYFDLDKYAESLRHTYISLKFSKEDDEQDGYINPLNLYRMQGFYDELLQLYLKKLQRFEQAGYFSRIPNIKIIIGNVYNEKGDYNQAIKYLSDGISSFQYVQPLSMLPGYEGLSKAYLLKAKDEKTYRMSIDSAIYYGKKALKSAEQLQNEAAVENCIVILGQAFLTRGKHTGSNEDFNTALNFFIRIEPLVKKSNVKSLLKEVYTGMADVYSVLGNYKKAYQFSYYASTLKDSIFNDESSIKIEKLKMQYEVDKAVSDEKAQHERSLYEIRLRNQNVLAEQKKLAAEKQSKNNRILMGSGLLFLTIIFSMLLIRQRSSKKRAIESVQSLHKMTELELQSLRAQLNPHFMFNSLNAIQELILMEDNERSHIYLSAFSDLLRTLLDNADQPFVSLRKEIDFLELYLSLENLRIPNLDYSIEIDPGINTEKIKIPNMMLQPYIENAIWHGLMHKKENRKLQIKIDSKHNTIIFQVEDNGVGRKKAAELKSRYRKQHRSKGMELLSKRFNLLSKEYATEVQTTVTDLYHNGEALGTHVEIIIPSFLSEKAGGPFYGTYNHN